MFPLMVFFIVVTAVVLWFLLARLFKHIGSGAKKIVEPLKEAEREEKEHVR